MAEPGSKIAERMFTRPQGATMDEIIAATGGPQYNVLKRLEARGHAVRKVKEGQATRYFVKRLASPVYGFEVNDKGQVTLPKGLREEMQVYAGQKLEAVVEDGNVVIKKKTKSIKDMIGILGPPPSGKHLSIEDIKEAIKEGAVERYLRATGQKT
jgi:antitoxin PrlF